MKKRMKALIALVCILGVGLIAFFAYVSDYYHADNAAVAALSSDSGAQNIGDMVVFMPEKAANTCLIFYPGGKVDPLAYVPLLAKLQQRGIACVLVKMPFNLAVFDPSAADRVYGMLPGIKNWFIGGHSLGGAMASSYAAGHKDKIKGLILLGAYVYGDWSPDDALTIYGSNDGVLDRSKITYTQNVFILQGGNHAQFGNYGPQQGDGTATIQAEDQQNQAADRIAVFIHDKEAK